MNIQKSSYIICIARIMVKEEYLEEVLKIFMQLKEVVFLEQGCIRYELHQSQQDPLLFTFIDRFESMEAFEYHCKQEIVVKYFDDVLTKLTKSIEITLHNEIYINE